MRFEGDPLVDAVCSEIGNLIDGQGLVCAGRMARIVGNITLPTEFSCRVHYGHHIGYGYFLPQIEPDKRAELVPQIGERNLLNEGNCVFREYDENGFGIYVVDMIK